MERIVENIKNIIRQKGLKQCYVAEKAGIPPKKFSNMLNGRRSIQHIELINICYALNVTPNDLYGLHENKTISTKSA